MLFTDDITHLPYEQEALAGPMRLGLMTPAPDTITVSLPDGTTMTIPQWIIPNMPEGNVLLMWKVLDDFTPVDPTVQYSNFRSNYSDPAFIRRVSTWVWDSNASGRFSTNLGNNIFTWRKASTTMNPSWYNPIVTGGHVGLLHIENHDGSDFLLPGGFGRNAEYVEWLTVAKVIGSPIYPSRTFVKPSYTNTRQVTKTTSGKAHAVIKSEGRVFMGRVNFTAEPDMTIARTLELLDDRERMIIMPCGLDPYAENHAVPYRRPGFAKYITLVKYGGITGYDGGLDDNNAFDSYIEFVETFRP